MNFKEKVQSMSAKDIILSMVKALTHPLTINIDMRTYGELRVEKTKGFLSFFRKTKKVCFGCAATNTVCKISGLKPLQLLKNFDEDEELDHRYDRAKNLDTELSFLLCFEVAINELRQGHISYYNNWAIRGKFAKIMRDDNIYLRYLGNDYTNADLEVYKQLADLQP